VGAVVTAVGGGVGWRKGLALVCYRLSFAAYAKSEELDD